MYAREGILCLVGINAKKEATEGAEEESEKAKEKSEEAGQEKSKT